jgi:hypothetical protein
MPDNDIVVVGLGMATAVGLSPMETGASVRAATMRFTESTWQDHAFQPFVIAEVPEDGLADLAKEVAQETSLTQREMRLLRLSTKPVLDSLKHLMQFGERPGLALALPWAETMIQLNRPLFLERLARQTGISFNAELSRADFVGRAGGLMAVAHASNLIRSQQARFMVAGGLTVFGIRFYWAFSMRRTASSRPITWTASYPGREQGSCSSPCAVPRTLWAWPLWRAFPVWPTDSSRATFIARSRIAGMD